MYCWDEPGRYPWPVTTSGEGPDATLWIPLGASRTMEREVTASGVQVYDLRGIVVARIPDLAPPTK